ncbi:hypothetical protein ACJX0J_036049, partial [Zea mays]
MSSTDYVLCFEYEFNYYRIKYKLDKITTLNKVLSPFISVKFTSFYIKNINRLTYFHFYPYFLFKYGPNLWKSNIHFNNRKKEYKNSSIKIVSDVL